MSSRWATNDADEDERVAQRKRHKEQKRKGKEERQRQSHTEEAPLEHQAVGSDVQQSGQPMKRQRTVSPLRQAPSEDTNMLDFPISIIRRCGDLDLYEVLNNIEEGSYGFVSRARVKASGDIVALKRLKIDHNNEGFPITGLREIQTLRACSHLHIVNLREVIAGPGPAQDIYLVMDFLEHDLKTILEDVDDPFSPSETKTLMLQICSATEYLHSNWIIHRDLKTSNILLNNRGEIKLADFGMARFTSNPPPKLTQLVVTLWYRAPELLLGAVEYSFEIDMWSVGCILAELLTREPIFQGRNEVSQLSAIFAQLGNPMVQEWPEFRTLPNAKALRPLLGTARSQKPNFDSTKFPLLGKAGLRLLTSLLALNPNDRPSATEALSHAYFTEAPRPKPKEMFPTFPSKAGQEKRRRKVTPQAPNRGNAPRMEAEDFASILADHNDERQGAGFSLRMA